MKYVAFDIETATITPENEDPHKYRPLGICVAATQECQSFDNGACIVANDPRLWYSVENFRGAPKMRVEGCRELADYLCNMADEGYFPLTWNGLGFDFDILAEECQDEHYARRLANLALNHIDMAFHMLCSKGFMIGMQAAALGLGLHGKSVGMHGDLAPKLWAHSEDGQHKVMDYVEQDVRTTSEIYIASMKRKGIPWTSKQGRPNFWPCDNWLVVAECLRIPEPDTSWMSDPRLRSHYTRWVERTLGHGLA